MIPRPSKTVLALGNAQGAIGRNLEREIPASTLGQLPQGDLGKLAGAAKLSLQDMGLVGRKADEYLGLIAPILVGLMAHEVGATLAPLTTAAAAELRQLRRWAVVASAAREAGQQAAAALAAEAAAAAA